MRASTIIKAVREINQLDQQYMDLEEAVQREFGWVPPRSENKIRNIREKSEKLAEKTIARMHAAGYCGEDGLTPDEADALCERFPELEKVEGLHVVGDGCWC